MAEERRRPQPHVQEAESALSERAQALSALLEQVLKDLQPEMGVAVDTPEVTVPSAQIVEVCRVLKEDPRLFFQMLLCIAGVDYMEHLQVVYVLLSLEHEHRVIVKTNVTYEDPRIASVTSLWKAAGWYEREAHDLFGIVFEGNADLRPLLLYEGFEGFPGRKEHPFNDYQEF